MTDDNGLSVLDDPRLFQSDFFKCVAQELLVLKTDVGDDAQVGLNDVGAVEPATQPCLDDGNIDVAPCEVVKCHC